MTKTIVVPLDGSARSEKAIEPASWLADTFGAELQLVIATFSADTSQEESILERAEELATAASVRTEILEHSFAGRAIIDRVRSAPEAVLCMSTRGRSGVGEMLLGSVSDEVLREVNAPVVLVGPSFERLPEHKRDMVVCIDGSAASSTIIPVSGTWAHDLALRTHVFTVASSAELAASGRAVAGRIEDAAAALRAFAVTATIEVREGPSPADEVVELATSLDATLVALATHGHTGWTDRAMGRVATAIVRHSPCPVLVRRYRTS